MKRRVFRRSRKASAWALTKNLASAMGRSGASEAKTRSKAGREPTIDEDAESVEDASQLEAGNGTTTCKDSSSQQDGMDWGVIHPLRPWRLAFDYFLMCLIVYSIIVVPYRLAFNVPAENDWLAFELTVDGFFLMDIVLNFNTAIWNNSGELVGKRQTITEQYLRGWFTVDFLSTVPFGLIVDAIVGLQNTGGGNDNLRWFRLARLLKLVCLLS
jgi:hypothetical protein